MVTTVPIGSPGFSATSQAAGPPATTLVSPVPPEAALGVESMGAPAHTPARKWKLIPLVFGLIVVALLAEGIWAYWKFHRKTIAPPPASQVAVQPQPAAPPAVPTPASGEAPTPAQAATADQEAPPESVAPAVVEKKTVPRRAKHAAAAQPVEPAPPPPAQPEPAAVTPSPNPAPATPSAEEIATAEYARLASTPRVVQVLCNFDLKEAAFTFSASGQTLFEETLKGKRKKEGFLGIKGSYQGTLSRTITIPAGAEDVSIHVSTKEGAKGMDKAIKMPPPGGFVPTLNVQVDADHLSLNWKGSGN